MRRDTTSLGAGNAADGYAAACAGWQAAVEEYLRLARTEASAGRLRAAALAVHAAALRKGRLANPLADPPP